MLCQKIILIGDHAHILIVWNVDFPHDRLELDSIFNSDKPNINNIKNIYSQKIE